MKWLEPNGPAVFVPVLMGARVIVSVMAMALERLARATARPVLERRLADRLAPMMLPSTDEGSPKPSLGRHGGHRPLLRTLLLIALTLAVAGGIDSLGDLTQTRPDAARRGLKTSVLVEVEATARPLAPVAVANRLWEACRSTVSANLTIDLQRVGRHAVRIELQPALGKHQETRLRGCLEDMTLDNVQADVVGVQSVPTRPIPLDPSDGARETDGPG